MVTNEWRNSAAYTLVAIVYAFTPSFWIMVAHDAAQSGRLYSCSNRASCTLGAIGRNRAAYTLVAIGLSSCLAGVQGQELPGSIDLLPLEPSTQGLDPPTLALLRENRGL